MLVKKVKYKDFDGTEVEEVVRLNLTNAELMRLDAKYEADGGFFRHLKKLITTHKDGDPFYKPMLDAFETLILSAYGKKTEDGKFIKKEHGALLADEFESSEAYSVLFTEFLQADQAENERFLRAIFPPISDEDWEKGRDQVKKEIGKVEAV